MWWFLLGYKVAAVLGYMYVSGYIAELVRRRIEAKRRKRMAVLSNQARTMQAWANALYYMKEIYFPDIEEQLIPTPTEDELFRLYNLQAEEKERT